MTEIRRTPNVHVHRTQPRVTPSSGSDRFREALGQGARQLLAGVEQAATLVPGGSVVTAAVRGGSSALQSSTAAESAEISGASAALGAEGEAGGPEGLLSEQTSTTMQLLELQQRIAMEQRQFTTVSNVMKARHDTAKQVIGNVR